MFHYHFHFELYTLLSFEYLHFENIKHKTNHHFFHFEFKDSKNREYEDLSSGEKNLYGQLINIYYYDVKYDNKELIYLFDEPEITLHPNWQRNYINEFYLISKILNKRIRFLIASHSPFILSDLPKESIIFLEKGKQVYPFENGQTFGANIHTLLSHGFFMKDGLMGEFAKKEINQIIENLNSKNYNPNIEEKKKILMIINIIGEDFLRTKLLDMYYKKFDDDLIKQQRKNELELQKAKIEEELKNL